jgi:N-acylneuraminate cytidylyltransferase/CMP-N,N'-diacetyllegionaminic acid synthase
MPTRVTVDPLVQGNVLMLVPARGGSKGLPGKNARPFLGKPLVARAIQTAADSRVAGRIVVSTDNSDIARAAKDYGAEVPFLRPGELAGDESPVLAAALHALDWLEANEGWKADWLLLLQPTSPLRTADDIRGAFAILNSGDADAVVSVTEAKAHPFWVKSLDPQGYLRPFVDGQAAPTRRQDLPPAFSLNGMIYLVRTSALREERDFCPKKTFPLVIPAARAFDIDCEQDFLIAEYAGNLMNF